MHKLLLIVLMMSVWMLTQSLQTDEEMAAAALFQGKRAVNRAAHAAAQQLDPSALAEGILRIDEEEASSQAEAFLQANLQLDAEGRPLPNSYWQDRVEVLVFEVINSDRKFPYTYSNADYDYEVTLRKPGVVMIINLVYPRVFSAIEPIEWQIKGAAELVDR